MHDSIDWMVVKPSTDIAFLFNDKIKYVMPATHGAVIDNGRLEMLNILPNLYEYLTFEEVIKHLQDPSKDYYLSKVANDRTKYKLYVVERSRLAHSRQEKIDKILEDI